MVARLKPANIRNSVVNSLARKKCDLLLLLFATLAGFLVLGYHPFGEDGGIYAPAIAYRMDPTLFRWDRAWVVAHTRFALFVPATAMLLRMLHLPLSYGLLLLQIAGFFCFLAAVLHLARLCFPQGETALWTTLLVALVAGMPIAGTSLYLVDPYLTARFLTTPLLLWAFGSALQGRIGMAAALWIVAASMHPLMAIWGILPILFVIAITHRYAARSIAGLCALALLVGYAISRFSPPDSAIVHTLAVTRAYWFLSQWKWYELAGAFAPLLLLFGIRNWLARHGPQNRYAQIALDSNAIAATLALTLGLIFAQESRRSTFLARLQPLRTFHEFYLVFLTLLLGMLLTWLSSQFSAPRKTMLLAGVSVAIAGMMFWTQRSLYPSSDHLELPCTQPRNQWVQAFAWIRTHTAEDDLFALDARYTFFPGEDAQGFRAIALRSVLPDLAKDGGIAAVIPSLADEWSIGSKAQSGLNQASDTERRNRLEHLGVRWIILPTRSATAFPCPYRNVEVQVCRLH